MKKDIQNILSFIRHIGFSKGFFGQVQDRFFYYENDKICDYRVVYSNYTMYITDDNKYLLAENDETGKITKTKI